MEKLNSLVALRGIDDTAAAKYFIDDLPGMGGELLENLTGRDAQDLGAVWEKVKRRASVRLLSDAELRLSDLLNWERSVYQAEAPTRAGRLDPVPAGATSVGVQVYIPDAARLDVVLASVRFYCSAVALVQLAFLDVATGQPLQLLDAQGDPLPPMELTTSVGLNVVDVQGTLAAEYSAVDFFVGLSILDETSFADLGFAGFALDGPAAIGLTAAALVGASLEPTATNAAAALVLDLAVDCSLAKAVDRNARGWAIAWLYLLGAEVLNEKIYSPRTNYFASGNLARSEELRDDLLGQYQGALGRIVRRVDLSDLCADCLSLGGVTYALDQMP